MMIRIALALGLPVAFVGLLWWWQHHHVATCATCQIWQECKRQPMESFNDRTQRARDRPLSRWSR